VLGASVRWLAYHSKLGAEDGIIFGASKLSQLDESVGDVAKGPLPQGVLDAIEALWLNVKDLHTA
jgi:aflatoxin B1 aldehyde reductase